LDPSTKDPQKEGGNKRGVVGALSVPQVYNLGKTSSSGKLGGFLGGHAESEGGLGNQNRISSPPMNVERFQEMHFQGETWWEFRPLRCGGDLSGETQGAMSSTGGEGSCPLGKREKRERILF